MVVKNIPYKNPPVYLFVDQKRKLAVFQRVQKIINKFDLETDIESSVKA